ncbi:MAG: type II secretion system F family protein [Bacillota bacterium]
MTPEIAMASILAGGAGALVVYGSKMLAHRDISISQFMPGKFDSREIKGQEKTQKQQPMPTSTVLLILIGGTVVGGVTYTIVGIWWLALIASLLGLMVPRLWINWQKAGRHKHMASQMEQAMETMSAVLRSGGGLPAALERAARDIVAPLSSELAQTAAEIKLGKSSAEAFHRLADRINLPEMAMLSLAVELQQTGMAVNIANVFGQIQENIRGGQALSEEVSAITAENRLAGWIVAAVPFGVLGLIRQMAPEFVAPLFNTPLGLVIFGVSTAAIIGGIIWIMRMSSVADS